MVFPDVGFHWFPLGEAVGSPSQLEGPARLADLTQERPRAKERPPSWGARSAGQTR